MKKYGTNSSYLLKAHYINVHVGTFVNMWLFSFYIPVTAHFNILKIYLALKKNNVGMFVEVALEGIRYDSQNSAKHMTHMTEKPSLHQYEQFIIQQFGAKSCQSLADWIMFLFMCMTAT